MKHFTKVFSYKTIVTLFLLSFFQVIAWAQDSSVSTAQTTTTTTTENNWYTQPWVWVVGAAVLILLIVALVRGNNSSGGANTTDKVTYTKTTERDTNP